MMGLLSEKHKSVLTKPARVLFFAIFPFCSTLILIVVCYANPQTWYSELLAFTIPPIMIYSAIVFLVYWRIKPSKFYLFFISLSAILCIHPLFKTVALNFKKDNETADFKVMSYNVAAFNPNRMTNMVSDIETYRKLYKWFRDNESPDILCFQEFYHGAEDDYDLTLDSIALLGGYKYYYINPRYNRYTNGIYGVITFSKYRAVSAGQIFYGDTLVNKGIYNDFVINDDTIRVVNFQLRSMSIRWQRADSLGMYANLNYNVDNIIQRLIHGNEMRKNEVAVIDSFLTTSRFKTIVCADINSVPYSAIYQRLNKNYYNAFEKGGTGLGFTYNQFPYVIRIDNQFYDKRLDITYFNTLKHLDFSDHFPIEAGYRLSTR